MNNDEQLLKTADVQKRLNCGRDKVLDLIETGRLRAIWLGPKSPRIYESSLTELIENGK